MPRKYKKKLGAQGNRNYNEAYLRRAVNKVKNNEMSLRKASEMFAVPYSTLQRWVKGGDKLMKYGRTNVLSEKEEKCLVKGLLLCAHWGFPLGSRDIRLVVQEYLNSKGVAEPRFAGNMPGVDWLCSFMSRNKELTVKFSENIKRARAGVSQECIVSYFKNLEKSLEGVPLSHIINYDETNFTNDPGAVKVVVKRGAKHPERIVDWSKSNISVMIAAAADGHVLPPYVVYKAKRIDSGWTEGGISGSAYNRNSSGWFDIDTFCDWFSTIILPYCRRIDGPKLLIGDNLSSHLTLEVIKDCEMNNIHFVLLPPNSTHICQPLDVVYFRPLKRAWRKVLDVWKMKNRGPLPKREFPRFLKSALETINSTSAENVRSGFNACGIVPLDPQKVLTKLPEKCRTPYADLEQSSTNTLPEHLQKTRESETSGNSCRAGKRMKILLGKSVQCGDFDVPDCLEEREIDDDNRSNMKIEEKVASEIHYDKGDHVLVSFQTERRERRFLGIVMEADEATAMISFLRKKEGEKDSYFVYPAIADIQSVALSNIICKVKVKDLRRGRYGVSDINLRNVE